MVMSSLWENKNNKQKSKKHNKNRKHKKLLTINKKPFPKHNIHIPGLAQDQLSIQSNKFPFLLKYRFFIERISLFISRFPNPAGSMTVEAAIVLPLFLFFFLNMGCAIEIIRIHGNMELALWETGNRLAVYGAVLEDIVAEGGESQTGEDDFMDDLAGVSLAYTYVKSQIINFLSSEYLEQSPLSEGSDSLQFLESTVSETEDTFEIIVTYQVSPLVETAGFSGFRMANRYYGHVWNGYEIATESEDVRYVYVTENGSVYHNDRNCTHLELSISSVRREQAMVLSNADGLHYVACEKCCGDILPLQLYITEEGRCYHTSLNCPGMKRTVYYVPVSEVPEFRECSRCGGS